jgi:ribosomal protein L32
MNRPVPWLWIALLGLLLLAPGASLRVVFDLLGGLTLVLVLITVLGAGAAVIGWQVLRRRVQTCPACGTLTMATEVCPACGSAFQAGDPTGIAAEARDATITVTATEVDDSSP